MITKNQIKFLKSLSQKKHRIENNKCLIEGKRIVDELIQSGRNIEQIIVTDTFIKKNPDFILFNSEHQYEIISDDDVKKIKNTENSQEIFALVATGGSIDSNLEGPVLILNNISDPGNLGSLLRTASWYNINNIFVSDNSVDIYNPKVVRSSMGAHFYLSNLHQIKNNEIISILNKSNFVVIAATLDGVPHREISINKKWALILGNEAHGIDREMLHIASESVSIPRLGNMESLNVAIAGSILIDRFIGS
jgi:TrmH family RNA methyltransferase